MSHISGSGNDKKNKHNQISKDRPISAIAMPKATGAQYDTDPTYQKAMKKFEEQSAYLRNYLRMGSGGTFITHSNLISAIPPAEIEALIDAFIDVCKAKTDDNMQYIYDRAKINLKIAMLFDAKNRKALGEDKVESVKPPRLIPDKSRRSSCTTLHNFPRGLAA